MGVRGIEFDLRMSADKEIFVIHDTTLDRTTTGSGLIAETPAAEIRKLDAGSWFAPEFRGEPVPLFDDVLARYDGRIALHIEIKDDSAELAQIVAGKIIAAEAFERCWVTSFHPGVHAALRACSKDLRLAYVMRKRTVESVETLRAADVQMVCPHALEITPDLVEIYHAAGFLVRTWGVKGDADLLRQISTLGIYGSTFSDLKAALEIVSPA